MAESSRLDFFICYRIVIRIQKAPAKREYNASALIYWVDSQLTVVEYYFILIEFLLECRKYQQNENATNRHSFLGSTRCALDVPS